MCWVSRFKWQPLKAKLHSLTFIKYCLLWPASVSTLPAVVNLITCSTSHKTSLPAVEDTATFHLSSGKKQKYLPSRSARWESHSLVARSFQISTSDLEAGKRWRARQGAEIDGWVGRNLTELKAVDAQAGVRGVVEPPLLPPAAGGVCVHLPRCNTCKRRCTQARQFQLCSWNSTQTNGLVVKKL